MLITHLAAAESRCVKLERQLDHMRRMLRNVKADRTSMLKEQVSPLFVSATGCDIEANTLHLKLHKNTACMNVFEFNRLV